MNCMFCQSEINKNDVIKDGLDNRIAGQKTCPGAKEILGISSVGQNVFQIMTLSRFIREICEQSDDNRLQTPLSIQALSYLWMKK